MLITGSRHWADVETMVSALNYAIGLLDGHARDSILLIEGECPYGGADVLARDLWWGLGRPVLGVPANWPVLGKRAGFERNQRMVDMMPDLVLAFPEGESRGTRDCMRRASEAGIRVSNWGD